MLVPSGGTIVDLAPVVSAVATSAYQGARVALSHLPRRCPGAPVQGIGEGFGEERVSVDVGDARTIGARLRQIRR